MLKCMPVVVDQLVATLTPIDVPPIECPGADNVAVTGLPVAELVVWSSLSFTEAAVGLSFFLCHEVTP